MPEEKKEVIKIIEPHKKISAPVAEKHLIRVMELAPAMADLCKKLEASGVFKSAFALAHPQISKKCLRFFVINTQNLTLAEKKVLDVFGHYIICDPNIVRHTKIAQFKEEGCLSFPGKLGVKTLRYHKLTLEYQHPIEQDNGEYTLSEKKTAELSGLLAQMVQHEVDHFNAKYIYEI